MSVSVVAPLAKMQACDLAQAQAAFKEIFVTEAVVQLAHPFETMDVAGFCDGPLAQLYGAIPDVERRVWISMCAEDTNGALWVGQGGHYAGLFAAPFLDIPPTQRWAHMRFHEFYRIEDGKVVEMQAIWDIPELMMQAGCWPLSPSLGREMMVPAPMTCDGLQITGDGSRALQVVNDMLEGLSHNREGEAAMKLDEFWHPQCSWYGPAGIGTARGIRGFRNHHQIPFLNAMPNRVGGKATGHLFASGDYVAFTAWPGMHMTLDGSGWLGIPPVNKQLTMRSLDFWRVDEGAMIRENWVLVDMLHVYHQLGVDVLARMREMTQT